MEKLRRYFRDMFWLQHLLSGSIDLVVQTESLDPKMVKLSVHAVISGRDFSKLSLGDHPGPFFLILRLKLQTRRLAL